MSMDLYLLLKQKVGCCYIGDMAVGMQYNGTARRIVSTLRLEDCAELQLLSVYAFLTGKTPQSANKADVISALQSLA